MFKEEVLTRIPMNLQFFAEGDEGTDGSEGNAAGEGDSGDSGDQNQNKGGEQNQTKTFSQDEVTAMMTREKKEGKKSVLNSLGFKSEKEAQDAFKVLQAITKAQKSDDQQNADTSKVNDETAKRAEAAENKLALIVAGVKADSVDDALAIAMLKVTEEKSLDDVLKDMKKEKKYAGFFGEVQDSGSEGTGKKPGNSKQGKDDSSIGKRLAESRAKVTAQQKSSFF